jgi:CheY-like chemotaxis protein
MSSSSNDTIRLKERIITFRKKKSLIKILYVEPGVDEKEASKVLEKCTEGLDECCFSFTVVPNAFLGLECTEHTSYDIIIIQASLPQINAVHFLNILKTVGAQTPVVLLVDLTIADEWIDIQDKDAKELGFTAILRKPFSTNHLCNLIKSVIEDSEEAAAHAKKESLDAISIIASAAAATVDKN